MNETGNLSINSENFLPIIKKWLYTDQDIFIRELVSNACDAVTKLKKLMLMGEADHIPSDETFSVRVVLNRDEKTIQIIDNGIGMTDEEIKKYINQIAFSGATDFLAKYEEKTEEGNEIIGHFGLGFYSAFMVAERVEIDTLSFLQGAAAAKWSCDDGIDYEITNGTRTERGTTITLFLSKDGEAFMDEGKLYAALNKYCAFMPVPIYVDIVSKEDDAAEAEKAEETEAPKDNTIHISEEEAKNLTKEDLMEKVQKHKEQKIEAQPEEASANTEQEEPENQEEQKPLNDPCPLWLKQPKDCTDEEYKEFYHKVFFDMNDPLFWIHLNMDYPFRLKGILYFPKLVEQMDVVEGQIKLYSNQVYIADNIKEVVPEFLLLLKGVLDCPDMPLNVSRSALQNDGYVEKMNSYITKKVADKLNQLFKADRSVYESFWDDIGMFFKYGCMREEKLYDKIKDSLLLKTTDGVYETIQEYLDKNKEKHENKIFFVTDEAQQAQYIRMFKEQGLEAAILTTPVDKPFVSFLEYKNPGVKVQRIDADISDTLQEKSEGEESEAKKQADAYANTKMETMFRDVLQNENLKVKTEALKIQSVPAMILLSEESRRMMEMMEAYGNNEMYKAMFAQVKPDETLVLNKTNPLIQFLSDATEEEDKKEDRDLICHQVYDLALMSHRSLTSEEMTTFIDRSNRILEKLAALEK